MTPLAHRITKELTLPVKDRTFIDNCGLLRRMDDIHCFDATSVLPMARDLAVQIVEIGSDEILGFLPAPKTWIEWETESGVRFGFLLEDSVIGRCPTVRIAHTMNNKFSSFHTVERLPLAQTGVGRGKRDLVERYISTFDEMSFLKILAVLAIINSPRVLGRRQHMPHRALERNLVRQKDAIGMFPLHAWTEIILECKPPKDLSDMHDYEAHLTGEKCLHFCRAHLRIKNGHVEFVSAHWRGDAALGIKQSRYVLTP